MDKWAFTQQLTSFVTAKIVTSESQKLDQVITLISHFNQISVRQEIVGLTYTVTAIKPVTPTEKSTPFPKVRE